MLKKLFGFKDTRPPPPKGEPKGTNPNLSITVTHVETNASGRHVNGVLTPLSVEYDPLGWWNVESESSPGEYYAVLTDQPDGWACTCRDYENGTQAWKRGVRTCKHIALVVSHTGQVPVLKQVNRKTGEASFANDNFVRWYMTEGLAERHGIEPL